jgi:pimeloyl-ACP methyl ester carboxylesterase
VRTEDFSPPTKAWLASGRHIEVDGRRIFAVERGAGPALLLMHGFPTSCYDWRSVMDALSGSYRCVAFDFPGYGLSDKPAAYSYSLFQQADAVEGLARSLDITSAHVVSHDVGTSVHCELLARHNEGRLTFDVTASTFLNGSMLQWRATITAFQKLLSANETLPQAIELCDKIADAYMPGLRAIMKKPDAVSEEDALVMSELLRYQDGNKRLPAIAGYMRERYVNSERWLGALGATRAPLQFVWADGDPIANIEMGRELHATYPKARYTELTGLGHFLLMEDAAAVAREIPRVTEGPRS